jgi:hypothetical protein
MEQSGVGDPAGGGDVVHRHAPEAALPDQHGRRLDDLQPPIAGRQPLSFSWFDTVS